MILGVFGFELPKGYLPSSPYTIKSGVDCFSWRSLQNFRGTLSRIALFENPKTSQPYNKMGCTVLHVSNQDDTVSTDYAVDLFFFKFRTMLLFPFLFVFLKLYEMTTIDFFLNPR